jgi:hypothetical protein
VNTDKRKHRVLLSNFIDSIAWQTLEILL